MKLKRLKHLRPAALAAVGVFLGRAAQADTVIDFDTRPIDQQQNAPILQGFGDNASASSDGVTVTGFGTPNIGITWVGLNNPNTRWDYYNDSVWSAGQLNQSTIGSANEVIFTPDNASARVVIKSFNFHPYYDFASFGERFTYDVTVLAVTNVVAGPIHITFQSDAMKDHPVNINYTGLPGQALKLRMTRVPSVLGTGESEGDPADIAADDILFAQLPTTSLPHGPQVISQSPVDDDTSVAGASYPYSASITNGNTTVVGGSIQLKLDGVSVTPTITSDSGLTNVSYAGGSALLAPGSTHIYSLTYNDNGAPAASYSNIIAFTVVNYPTLPASYALPVGSGHHPGFVYKVVMARQDTPDLDSTVARARAQLDGTLIDSATSSPYTNAAPPGTNADGSFNIDTVLNFNDNGQFAGNFGGDTFFPGLDSGPYNWFSTEATLYLDLAAGYYRLGVNSDDGFEMDVLPRKDRTGSPIVLGLFDNGRSASDSLFDFFVQTPGVYPFDLVYFESTVDASCELFSVDLATSTKILVNDLDTPGAVKSYYSVAPLVTSIARSGSNVVLNWVYGVPPFQVKFKNSLTDATWTNIGSTTTSRTATIPITSGARFFVITGQ